MKARPATVDDAEAIARVQLTTWRDAYAELLPGVTWPSEETLVERRRAWLDAPPEGSLTLVGELYGRIEGFANAGPGRDDPSVGELYAIYVLPQAQGTGLGKALHDSVLAGLAEGGFGAAVLGVLVENARARQFYEREGWTLDGEADSEFLGVAVREARYRRALTS